MNTSNLNNVILNTINIFDYNKEEINYLYKRTTEAEKMLGHLYIEEIENIISQPGNEQLKRDLENGLIIEEMSSLLYPKVDLDAKCSGPQLGADIQTDKEVLLACDTASKEVTRSTAKKASMAASYGASEVGSYVKYKGSHYLVVRVVKGMLLLLSPTNKIQVKATSVKVTTLPPATITPCGQYLVTKKELIVSLTTYKFMKWEEKNGNRVRILASI